MAKPLIAIVHYHLRRGGVMRVIQHTLNALESAPYDVCVVTGEMPTETWAMLGRLIYVEGLGYEDTRRIEGSELAANMESAVEQAVGRKADLWHIHNHSLGKNMAMAGAVVELARAGRPLLLQPHDFAEDGRSANYRNLITEVGRGRADALDEILYPSGPHIHYACLNSRDLAILRGAGLPDAQSSLLPNAVVMRGANSEEPNEPSDRPLYIYPTRAIRRKNLGEFLLWAALDPDSNYAVTLAPENPAEMTLYQRWRTLAGQLALPVIFEYGRKSPLTFEMMLHNATAVISTSIQEGFGMAFLEPWLVNRPLIGRNLPDITRQFADDGIDLSGTYDRLMIPLEWVGAEAFRDSLRLHYERTLDAYGRSADSLDEEVWERVAALHIERDRVDFGRLDLSQQIELVRRAALEPEAFRDGIEPCFLHDHTKTADAAENRRRIESLYNLDQYGARLRKLYDKLLEARAEPPGHVSGERVLEAFLHPRNLWPLLAPSGDPR